MLTSLSTIFAGLLIPAQQDVVVISTKRDIPISPKYRRTTHESACGPTVLHLLFRSGPDERGVVEHLLVDGRSVPGAAEMLNLRAARRWIERIEIIHCGMLRERPEFHGIMELSKAESQNVRLRPTLSFRITRQGREGWRLTTDD